MMTTIILQLNNKIKVALYFLVISNMSFASCVLNKDTKYSKIAYTENPALEIYKRFSPIRKEDFKYINPYMLNIKAIYLLKKDVDYNTIKNYIVWYLQHTNYPDKFGLTGTIYDYSIDCKSRKEKPTLAYDSVDGYAGTFLTLLYIYYVKTKDKNTIQENWSKIKDIAYLISHLQDKDGLITALPNNKIKYLADNCEAYGGIRSYNRLKRAMKMNEDMVYYTKLENSIRKGILSSFFNEKKGNFYWAIEEKKLFISDWNRFYPDAFAQIFPSLYAIDEGVSRKEEFLKRYTNKSELFSLEQKLIFKIIKKGDVILK